MNHGTGAFGPVFPGCPRFLIRNIRERQKRAEVFLSGQNEHQHGLPIKVPDNDQDEETE